jgi:hypothetical protein
MKRRGRERLEALLLEGIASGEPAEVTPAYQAELRREVEETITRKGTRSA